MVEIYYQKYNLQINNMILMKNLPKNKELDLKEKNKELNKINIRIYQQIIVKIYHKKYNLWIKKL